MTLEPYDTHPLRYHVAKRLDLNDVPDDLWNKGVTRRHVQLWNSASSTADKSSCQDRLVELVREDLRAVKNLGGDITAWTIPQKKGSASVEADLSPDGPIALRALALCVYWAKLAAADTKVRSFREKVTGGAEISADMAHRLIVSPATAVMRPERFAGHGVPIVGHTAELEVSERSHPLERYFAPIYPSERPYRLRGRLHIEWPAGHSVLPVNQTAPAPPDPMEVWDGTKSVLVAPWSSSVLGELRALASELAERYPWAPMFAAWFVLTGEPPWVPPLTATASGPDDIKNYGAITIKVAHWVPEAAISKFYSGLKSKMGAAPTTSPRRLTLFRFVAERSSGITEHLEYGLNIPPWRSLLAEWNEDYPLGHEWHYHDVRNFQRDFAEASKSLIGY